MLDRVATDVTALEDAASSAEKVGDIDRAIEMTRLIAERNRKAKGPRLKLARLLTTARRFDEAEELLNASIRSGVNKRSFLIAHANVAEARGDLDGSLERWRAIHAQEGDDVHVLLGLSRVLVGKGSHPEAIELLVRARAIDPDNRNTTRRLASALYLSGDPEGALALRIELLTDGAIDDFKRALQLLIDTGQLADAARVCAEARERWPDDLKLALRELWLAESAADSSRVAGLANKLVRQWPSEPRSWCALVDVLLTLGETSRAESAARQGAFHCPDNPDIWMRLATVAFREANWATAIGRAHVVLRRWPDYQPAWRVLAQSKANYLKLPSRYTIPVDQAADTVTRFSDVPHAHALLAESLIAGRRFGAAKRLCKQALERWPTDRWLARERELAIALQDARATLRAARRRFPADPSILSSSIYLNEHIGDYSQALDELMKLRAGQGDRVKTARTSARLLLQSGRIDEAVGEYRALGGSGQLTEEVISVSELGAVARRGRIDAIGSLARDLPADDAQAFNLSIKFLFYTGFWKEALENLHAHPDVAACSDGDLLTLRSAYGEGLPLLEKSNLVTQPLEHITALVRAYLVSAKLEDAYDLLLAYRARNGRLKTRENAFLFFVLMRLDRREELKELVDEIRLNFVINCTFTALFRHELQPNEALYASVARSVSSPAAKLETVRRRAMVRTRAFKDWAACYRERMTAATGGRDYPAISYICPINRPEDAENLVTQLSAQRRGSRYEWIFGINNCDYAEVAGLIKEAIRAIEPAANYRIIDCGKKKIGSVVNSCIEISKGDLFFKFDSDDLYGSEFTNKMVLYHLHHDAAIVTQNHNFVYLEGSKDLYLHRLDDRNPYGEAFYGAVHGAVLAFSRAAVNKVCFDEAVDFGEDTSFGWRAQSLGLKVVSADPFDQLSVKRDLSRHTYKLPHALYMFEDDLFLGEWSSAAAAAALTYFPGQGQ